MVCSCCPVGVVPAGRFLLSAQRATFCPPMHNGATSAALTPIGAGAYGLWRWRCFCHCNVTGADPCCSALQIASEVLERQPGDRAHQASGTRQPGNQAIAHQASCQAGHRGARICARADAGNRLPDAVVSTPDAGHIRGLIGRLWRTASRPGSARGCPPAARRPTPAGCPSPDAGRLSGRDRPGRSPWGCRPRIDAGPGSTPAARRPAIPIGNVH